MSLKRKAAKGAFWNLSTDVFSHVVSFTVYAILARLLTVEEFGLAAFAFLVLDFAVVFLALGINQNLIQRSQWCDDYAATAFSVMVAMSTVVSFGLALLVVPLLYFFYDPVATVMILALAIVPVLNSLRLVHNAKFQRDFRQKEASILNVIGNIVGGVISITLALMGWGVWSIVIGRICQAALISLMFVVKSDVPFRLKWHPPHVQEIKAFGMPLLGNAITHFFVNKATSLAVAGVLGPVMFGFFSVSKRASEMLYSFSFRPLNKMLVPSFSRLEQDAIPSAFYRAIRLAGLLIVPIFLGVGATSEQIIQILFGEKWLPSAVLMTISTFGVFAAVISVFLGNTLISIGETKAAFKLTLINLAIYTPLVFAGSIWGVEGVASSAVFASLIATPWRYRVVKAFLPIQLRIAMQFVMPSYISGLAMFALVYMASQSLWLLQWPVLVQMVLLAMLGACLYVLLLRVLFAKYYRHVLRELGSLRAPKNLPA